MFTGTLNRAITHFSRHNENIRKQFKEKSRRTTDRMHNSHRRGIYWARLGAHYQAEDASVFSSSFTWELGVNGSLNHPSSLRWQILARDPLFFSARTIFWIERSSYEGFRKDANKPEKCASRWLRFRSNWGKVIYGNGGIVLNCISF